MRQSERGLIYERALDDLRRRGLIYACECSRSDMASGRYPGTCSARRCQSRPVSGSGFDWSRRSSTSPIFVWGRRSSSRRNSAAISLCAIAHGNWTYQFAAAVDDWLQGMTQVIRGEDLLDSTGRQIQLARLLGREEPPAFLHHALLMKTPSQKLSKSDGDTGVRDLRAKGWSAEAVIDRAIGLAGLSRDQITLTTEN